MVRFFRHRVDLSYLTWHCLQVLCCEFSRCCCSWMWDRTVDRSADAVPDCWAGLLILTQTMWLKKH